MMTNNPTFKDYRFNSLPFRIVPLEGSPWFVVKDVALCLGYSLGTIQKKITSLTSHIDQDQKQIITVRGDFGEYPITLITESGVNDLIAKAKPPKPIAREFRERLKEALPRMRGFAARNS